MGKDLDPVDLEHRLTVLEQQSKSTQESVAGMRSDLGAFKVELVAMLGPIKAQAQSAVDDIATAKTWALRLAIGGPIVGGGGIWATWKAWLVNHFK